MKYKITLVFAIIALVLCCSPIFAQSKGSYTHMATEILVLVNKHRKSLGLQPLKANDAAKRAAQSHSKNMADKKVEFGHPQFNERMDALSRKINPKPHAWAENVASGQNTAQGALEDWLNSPGHKKNLEGDYNLTGIGIAKGRNGNLYFTQIFIR